MASMRTPVDSAPSADLWDLDPDHLHLNHGSFGAVPRSVRGAQSDWVRRSDANPVGFYREELASGIAAARRAGADFCGVGEDGFALIPNATTGASTILAGFPLEAGAEILVTDHAYGAVLKAAYRRAGQVGARVVVAEVPLGADTDTIVASILGRVSERTRIALVDQVTSATAMPMPVSSIAPALAGRGVAVLVDGAHAPGMLELDVDELGVDFWVGNFHKWAFAARTVAGLWVAPRWRAVIRPLVVSWNDDEAYPLPFDQQGTLDYSAWLALPDGLAFGGGLGWSRIRQHNADLARHGQEVVAKALGVDLDAVPSRGELAHQVSMRLVPLPAGRPGTAEGVQALNQRVYRELGVEAAMTFWGDRGWLRLSAQLYNTPEEYEWFGEALARSLG